MNANLELQLDERLDDRVVVSVSVAPVSDDGAHVDGAVLQLVGADGTELCPRTLLPISGAVDCTVAVSVELRASGSLPEGAEVRALAWDGADQVSATCPADPYIRLRDHMRGSRLGLPEPEDVFLETPSADALERLVARVPWVAQRTRPVEAAGVIEAREPEPSAEDLVGDLNLDEDCASWLKDLLEE